MIVSTNGIVEDNPILYTFSLCSGDDSLYNTNTNTIIIIINIPIPVSWYIISKDHYNFVVDCKDIQRGPMSFQH